MQPGASAMIRILFITGLVISGTSAGLSSLGMIESGIAAFADIVGIGLTGSSTIERH